MAQARRDEGGNLPIGPLQMAVIGALESGCTRKAAAGFAGIHRDTLYQWMRDPTFADMVEKAEDKAEAVYTASIKRAVVIDGNWTAAAWWLERRRPEEYGRRMTLNVALHEEVERVAKELGIDPEALLAEAEHLSVGAS